MKIGVISDTHVVKNTDLPEKLMVALKSCDLILHAGDLIELPVMEGFKKIEAVYGNMDSPVVKSALPEKKILEIEGKKICLAHGSGEPHHLAERLKEEFSSEDPDIIVFGHTHRPMNEYKDGILFFNPGSVTDTVFAPYQSYGIIEIKEGEISAEIHKL